MPTGCRAPCRTARMLWDGDTPCPLVGRVSMDLITVDITASARSPAQPRHPRPAPVASTTWPTLAGTIGYEILTGLGAALHPPLSGAAGVTRCRLLAALGPPGAGAPWPPLAASRSLPGRSVGHILRPPFYPREFVSCAAADRLVLAARRRPDRDLHRRRAGPADLRRRRALQRRGGGARRSSPSAWRASLARCWAG